MKANLYIVHTAVIAALLATAPANAKAEKPPVVKGQCSTNPRPDGKPPVIKGNCTTKPNPPKKGGKGAK